MDDKVTMGEGFAFFAWIRLIRSGAPLGPIAHAFALLAWHRGDR